MAKIIPYYDTSRKANMKIRKKNQAKNRYPKAMYSSSWHDFGRETLRGDTYIKRKLAVVAGRALYMLRRDIPLGDAKDGHVRNELRLGFQRFGGHHHDRQVFTVDYYGDDYNKWAGMVRRSTYPSHKAWKNAGRGVYGPIPSWLERTAKNLGGD